MPHHTGVESRTVTIVFPIHFSQVIAVLELEQAAYIITAVALYKSQRATGYFVLGLMMWENAGEVLLTQINHQLKMRVTTYSTLIDFFYIAWNHRKILS
jgi:hypothetical protein